MSVGSVFEAAPKPTALNEKVGGSGAGIGLNRNRVRLVLSARDDVFSVAQGTDAPERHVEPKKEQKLSPGISLR